MASKDKHKAAEHLSTPDILIVDDSAADAELTCLALKRAAPNRRTLWMSRPREALRFLLYRSIYQERPGGLPYLVLSDIHMPEMSGHQFLRAIRARPSLAGLPVIILSGSADNEDIAKAYRLGASGYVPKMADYSAFIGQMEDLTAYWFDVNKYPSRWRTFRHRLRK